MKSVSGGSREQVITGLSPNTQYYFKIRAVTDAGYSDYSQQIKVRTAASRRVVAPARFSATVDGTRMKLTWRRSTDAGLTGG